MNTELILMQLTKLAPKLESWARTQAVSLNGAEMIKLQDIHQQLYGQTFKSGCRACVNEGLTRLWKWYSENSAAEQAAAAEIAAEFEVETEPIVRVPAHGVKKRGPKNGSKKPKK